MEEEQEQGRELATHHGVVLKNQGCRDDDSLYSGSISLFEYSFGKCIEWRQTYVCVDAEVCDEEWNVVNAVGRRSRTVSGCLDRQNSYKTMRFPVADLEGFKINKKGQYLTILKNDCSSHTFFFQHGSAISFINTLQSFIKTVRSKKDKNLYIILNQPETEVLKKSFAELDLFKDNTTDVVWKFVSNLQHRPYETTMEAFSKLSDFWLKDSYGVHREEDLAEMLSCSRILEDVHNTSGSDEYEVINQTTTQNNLPPRPLTSRGSPLSIEEWFHFVDEEGRVQNVARIKEIIFRGGICPNLRRLLWRFLLGYYKWESTDAERANFKDLKSEEYKRMKHQWKTISTDQEQRFADFRERKSLIEKDVNRTDRNIPFFAGEQNPNLIILSDILMTYVMYNFDLGYVQGMNDLLAPILCLLEDEVDSFWCFVGLMDRMSNNFEMDQAGMKEQLLQLHTLLNIVEPKLGQYLDEHESGNMFFCFRWLLILFKREFSQSDTMRLWEVLWTDLPCPNFHLLICVAILSNEKNTLIENGYGFSDIIKHINELSLNINLDLILNTAESMYLQLEAAVNSIPTNVSHIIGLKPNVESVDESSQNSFVAENGHSFEDVNGPESLETISLKTNLCEAAFEKSLSNHYL